MDAALISTIVIAAGTVLVAIITTRGNRAGAKATEALSARVVDREDFQAVMARMDLELKRADERAEAADDRIAEVEKKLAEEIAARGKADSIAAAASKMAIAAEQRAVEAEKRADNLESRVAQLEEILRDNHIPVPPLTPD